MTLNFRVSIRALNVCHSISLHQGCSGKDCVPCPCLSLSPSSFEKLGSGLVFPQILQRLLQLSGNVSTPPDLSTMEAASPKVQRWNAVLAAVENLGIRLETEVKELILAGDSEVIAELLESLRAKELEWKTESVGGRRGKRPKRTPDGALFIESVDVSRPLSEAESCLEFLLIAFCTHFNLRQKQAAGLLTEGNKYLAVLLNKGLKGDFQPILRMLNDVRSNVGQLANCIRSEAKSGSLVLVASALRPGLLSKSEEVVEACSQVFRDLAVTMQDDSSLWTWFTGALGALEAAVNALRRGSSSVVKPITSMLFEVSRGRLAVLLLTLIKEQLNDLGVYMGVLAEVMRCVSEIEEGVEAAVSSGVLSSLIELCLREGDADARRQPSLRMAALDLLAVLWRLFHSEIDSSEDVRGSVLAILKKGCRDKSKALSRACIAHLFHLLDYFYRERHSSAAVLFVTLQLLLVEAFHRSSVREFMLENFVLTAEEIGSLPVEQLVDAVVKQVRLNEGLEFNTFDFDFFIAVSRHERLDEEAAVQLIDLLGKVYLNQVHLARAAGIPFMLLASRFVESELMQEYVYRFAKLSIQVITQGERSKRGQLKQLPRYLNQPVVLGQPLSIEDLAEETHLLQVRNLVLDLLSKIAKLSNRTLNERLKDVLASSAVSVKTARGEYPRGLIVVLALIGNPDEILPAYEASSMQLALRSPDRTPPRYLLALEDLTRPSKRSRVDPAKPVVLPKLDPDKPAKPKADKMKLMWEKKVEASKTGQAQILDSMPAVAAETMNVEISEEDWELVSVLLDKYARLVKHLFKSHAGSGYHKDMHSNPTFSHIADRKESISEGEMLAMLRDLGLSKQFLPKEDFISMVKSYLKKNGSKDTGHLDFEGFKDMLVKVAVICFARAETNIGHLPPVISVQALIGEFRSTVARAGGDTCLFDEPFLAHGDKDILRKLNRDLDRNPDTPMPPGYRSKIENDVLYEYVVPEELYLPQPLKDCLEIVDELCFAAVSVHVLEPMVVVQEVCVAVEDAKPMQSSSSFSMMKAANPRLARFTPGLKFETIRLFGSNDKALVLECALLVDDLMYAVENQMAAVYARRREFRTPNKIAAMQEVQEQMERLERDKSEQRRRMRRQELAQVIVELNNKKEQEREKAQRVKEKLE